MSTGHELLAALSTIPIEVVDVHASDLGPDGSISMVLRIPEDDVETGALSVIFAIGVVSYAEARPAGVSEMHYDAGDEWTIHDMVEHLRYRRGHLVLDTDYVRGRLMKTSVDVAPNGVIELHVRNRGSTARRWVSVLQGRGTTSQQLGVVGEEPGLFFAPDGVDLDPTDWPGIPEELGTLWADAAAEGGLPERVAEVLHREPKLAALSFRKGVIGEHLPGRPSWEQVTAHLTVYAEDPLGNLVALVVVDGSSLAEACAQWVGDQQDRQRQVRDLALDLGVDRELEDEVGAIPFELLVQAWAAVQQAADLRSTRAVLVVHGGSEVVDGLLRVLGHEREAASLVQVPEEIDGVWLWVAAVPV